jgi:hypothetical protein
MHFLFDSNFGDPPPFDRPSRARARAHAREPMSLRPWSSIRAMPLPRMTARNALRSLV